MADAHSTVLLKHAKSSVREGDDCVHTEGDDCILRVMNVCILRVMIAY